jgi:hypothetical protein
MEAQLEAQTALARHFKRQAKAAEQEIRFLKEVVEDYRQVSLIMWRIAASACDHLVEKDYPTSDGESSQRASPAPNPSPPTVE